MVSSGIVMWWSLQMGPEYVSLGLSYRNNNNNSISTLIKF